MKTLFNTFFSLILLLWLLPGCSSNNDDDDLSTVLPVPIALTEAEQIDLLHLREEEKLARDVYLYAYNKYNSNIFKNISSSEQTHMDQILLLLNKYNLDDPAYPDSGIFKDNALQQLYNELTALVDLDYINALKVGATIEDLDIKDIQDFINGTNKSDLLGVYENLMCGSKNHMRSYYTQIKVNNSTYDAAYITSEELSSIVNSTNQKCGQL